jgi:uncharacterized protein YndB with AHSA1/START domain
MSDRIEKSIELKAPIERVWRAIADPAEFGTWFRVRLETPFIPCEVSRGHITYPGYEHIVWEATIVAMEPPRLFSFRWHPYAIDPAVDYSGEPTTLVEFRLEPSSTGTRLTIAESGFDALPSHRRIEALRMNEDGWTEQVRNIRAHVGG